jgi:hypothetical protein
VGVSVKVGVGGIGVIVLVKVGVTKSVGVAEAAKGGLVGVGGNKNVYEHPERSKHKRGIIRYIFILYLLAQSGYGWFNCIIKGCFRVCNKKIISNLFWYNPRS